MTADGPREQQRAGPLIAPEATRAFYPFAVLRRDWLLFLTSAVIVSLVAITVLSSLPARSTATSQVRVFGTETTTIGEGSRPDDELVILLVEFESADVVEAAADAVGVPAADVDVSASSPRQSLFIDVTVTASSAEDAVAVANAIPDVVARARAERSVRAAEESANRLRSRADEALEQAAELESALAATDAPGGPAELFQLQQQRNVLASQYADLRNRAAAMEFEASNSTSRASVGFATTTSATRPSRSFPPPWGEAVPLALVAGLIAATGVVSSRTLLGRRLHREHLEEASGPGYLGVIPSSGRVPVSRAFRDPAARLRPLLEERTPGGLLVTMVSVDTPPAAVWWATTGLVAALCESGLDVAGLVLNFEHDASPAAQGVEGGHTRIEFVPHPEASAPSVVRHRCRIYDARRHGGTALAAVYSGQVREGISRFRARHRALFVDPSRTGVPIWLDAGLAPDLVVLVATEGKTTQGHYASAAGRLRDAGIDAAVVLLESGRHLPVDLGASQIGERQDLADIASVIPSGSATGGARTASSKG